MPPHTAPDSYDVAVIGGGIVGLATALALLERAPGLRLAILEKESRVGTHQTGHNSGVVHSGLYYRSGSHKARLCVEGARLMVEFCETHGLPVRRCGKVVVASVPDEVPRVEELYARGVANGVLGLERIGPERLREIEPYAAGAAAIYSPHTATVDFAAVAQAMAEAASSQGAVIFTGSPVTGIATRPDGVVLRTRRGDVFTRFFVNCAGLHSDTIARLAGLRAEVRIIPFRGEYCVLRPERRHLVRGLIYPVPDPRFPFLGAHLTRTVHDEVEAGPNAVLAFAREGYRRGAVTADLLGFLGYRGFWHMVRRYWRTGLDEAWRSVSTAAFVRALRRLVPELQVADVTKGGTGVRAQAVGPDGYLLDDFHILEASRGVHVLNAPSPAATASLAIGRHIAKLVQARLSA